ncbi:ABC transporter permease [Virgibacillus sediminis]|uniref:ABC transporter permease n=1 Tax=Virgibacillus sediminis TaxID=202260 RepID=A0ABV7A3Z6_9BACI
MSGKQIFIRRLVREYKFQWSVIRSILDWSIILYAVLPLILIAPFIYMEAWNLTHLYWSDSIPFTVLLFALLLFCLKGKIRTFAMEADLLHLIQQKPTFVQLKRYGLLYTALQLLVETAFIGVIFLPILMLIYNFSLVDALLLALLLCTFRFFAATVKKAASRALTKWIILVAAFILVYLFALFTSPWLYGVGSIVAFSLIYIYHYTVMTITNRLFLKEVEIEKAERMKYIKFLLTFSNDVHVEPIKNSQNNKPFFLFPDSKRIFKTRNKLNGLLEVLLKSFLRDKRLLTCIPN